MDKMMDGRVALVTGAGMGMGAATARLFARRGARVVVCDVDETAGRVTAAAIGSDGGEAHFVRADVSLEDEVAALVAEAVARFGRLDCAVNNAGIAPPGRMVAEADLDHFDRIIAVNLRSVLICMKHQIRQMIAAGRGGAIVNVGSVNSVRPLPTSAAYVAAKHGVVGLTKTASLEYAPMGIRVNAVLPGAIDTPMLRGSLEGRQGREEDTAPIYSLFGRFGRPEEVAEASLWLCSDASSYVTGHSLAVDAGYLSR